MALFPWSRILLIFFCNQAILPTSCVTIISDYDNGIREYWCGDNENPAYLNPYQYIGPPGFKNICDGSKDDCVYKGKKKCLESSECFGIMYHPRHRALKSTKISAIFWYFLCSPKQNNKVLVWPYKQLGTYIFSTILLILAHCKNWDWQNRLDLYIKETGETTRAK